MATKDLWGAVQVAGTQTPLSIMREQAALLGPKTDHLVEAQVETRAFGRMFVHSFNLVVPALDNYTYQLFQVGHGAELYPVQPLHRVEPTFVVPGSGEIQDEAEFIHWLEQRLSSTQTLKIISNLVAQARS